MKFVIPIRRLGVSEELVKAAATGFSRGPSAGHKYIKREFVGFKNGRIVYRYYYADGKVRESGKKQVEGTDSSDTHHEHELITNIHKLFKNLAKNRVKPSEVTEDSLARALGLEDVKVVLNPHFLGRLHFPFVRKEKEQPDEEIERFPLARVYRAFQMLPEPMRELIGEDQLKKIVVTTRDDPEEVKRWAEHGMTPPAGWSHGPSGEVRLLADGDGHGGAPGFTSEPVGRPRFGSRFTIAEEVVWHELAHQLHDKLIAKKSKLWEKWKELSLRDPQRISDYAFTNEKEDWAEAVACMISRPKQMARQCPARYDFFRESGLIPGPSREKMLKVPDEELRWWDLKQPSKASRRIAAQREVEGQPTYVNAYRSEKDQFYTVHYKGRAVFFRLGPPDKDADLAGWEAVPPTIDPETELPIYDSPTAARFQSQQVYKEIYDENGNALTPHQALLYLRQDDDDFNEKIDDDVENWQPGELQSHLGRILFAKLGESRASQEKERERVRKLRSKGKEGAELREDRHEWVPLEMTREEFDALTPTFKFEGMRKAEKQPFLKRAYDKKLKRPVVVTAHNPISGKTEPVRAATVYEMPNPDGTKTKITVNESEPFVPGGKLVLPLSVTRRDPSGVEFTEQQWIKYRIQPDGRLTPEEKPFEWRRAKSSGKMRKVSTDTWPELRWDRLEPAKLARDLGTTAETLLHKNGKIEAGQITDPMLAKLINPLGERIRNEGDLVKLMREAAKAQSSTWVTVQTGTDRKPSYAHIKITFDGGGNPLLAGEYWNRVLGVEQARVDSLLDSKNKINVEGVTEIKPRVIEFAQGALIQYRDPTSERIVYGTIVEIQDEFNENDERVPGKSTFKVKPLEGQGTGLAKLARIVEKDAQKVTTAIDADDATRRRRDVEPMKNHLLLYGDNLRFDADGNLRGGTVRLKLPSDGSISAEELRRFPAVRTDRNGPYVDLRDISVLREEFGGFVMDSYVQTLLDDLMKTEKRNVELAAQKDVVLPSQITSPDGGVNTDAENGGLLKGLKHTLSNGARFKLGSHQEEFLRVCARAEGRCMAAHFMGTGKTIAALAAIRLMKNAKKPDGSPVEGSPRKRVAIVVPLNTAVQWQRAAIDFTDKGATLIGSSTLAGAAQAFSPKNWPPKKDGESEEAYAKRVAAARVEWLRENPGGWDPEADKENDVVIIPFEYFRDNEADLRMHGGFDGIIVDEAHGIARKNELSRAVERWNPSMNMMLLLTGTPITNRLNTIPRYFDLLTNGKSPFGTEEEFTDRYLSPSAVMIANGSKNPPRTDLNPQRAAELASYLSARMHVALTEDVKGKTMPAVLLDENQPAHMTGMQEKVYRLAMAAMTEQEMLKLEEAGALGTDETAAFSGGMKRKVNVARSFANSPGYKPPDQREYVTYTEKTVEKKGKTGKSEIKEVERTFMLPDYKRCTGKPPHGFGGKWPSLKDVEKGRISDGEYEVLAFYVTQILGVDYDKLAGTQIDKELLSDIKKGTVNGTSWGKIPNPDYGPEGGIARGYLDPDGNLKPLVAEWNGERIEVPIGTKFIRDPSKKAAGLYYHQDDWDFNGSFSDDAEGTEGDDDDESVEEADGEKKKKGGLQQQKAKDPKLSIQLSPQRRRERAMFDIAMTANSAKADELERYMRERMNPLTGGNPDAQFILFGNRIGSSCRTMESKLRSMGYMDVNEALGHESSGYSSDEDKKRTPKMGYFVTYFGKGATLGDRDVNSEIFRKVKDDTGQDTETSMFVHRTLTGSVGKPPKIGEFSEGWSRAERQRISKLFAGPDGSGGVEVPMRVTTRVVGDETRLGYVYESEISAKDRKTIQELEQRRNGAPLEKKDEFTKQLNAIFSKYVTDRAPLSTRQIDVFNNCKAMIASDAAQVGLNWGNASELMMYDSLHSPMQEWQRITRAARMLDAIIPDKAKPVFDQLGAAVREIEEKNGLAEYENMESALSIVHEAWETLGEAEKSQAMGMGFNPIVASEAFFAQRAFTKIAELRPKVREQLRQYGRTLEPVERVDPQTGAVRVIQREIKPEEITSADVMNEILEKHLSPFEREILKSRKYLVNVKRLTTSVNMPVFKTVQVVDPETGEKKKIRIPTGEVVPEVPSKAELSQLTQGRAKQVPFEFFMKTVQDGVPMSTEYDFLPTTGHSLAACSQLPSAPRRERRPAAEAPQPPMLPGKPGEIIEAIPLSKTKQKQAEMAERARAAREKRAAKMAALKEKFDAQKAKADAKKRKAATKKAAATRAAKKGETTQKSFSRFFMPLSKFRGDA